jgi:hypothetical protein
MPSVTAVVPSADTIFGLSATDVTALATIGLAVVAALALAANVYVGLVTRRMAIATKNAAEATERAAKATEGAAAATQDEAHATRDEASATTKMVEEVRHDRELAYRPYISWRLTEARVSAGIVQDNPSPTLYCANFGRGPALHCLCAAFWPGVMIKVRSTILFDLSPNESTEDPGAGKVYVEPRGWDIPTPEVIGQAAAEQVPVGAPSMRMAFCQDQLGNAYRFVPYKVDADVWRPGEPRPPWLDWYEGRRTELELI